jgi:hypothetical protein
MAVAVAVAGGAVPPEHTPNPTPWVVVEEALPTHIQQRQFKQVLSQEAGSTHHKVDTGHRRKLSVVLFLLMEETDL